MTNERKNITQPADWWNAFIEEASKQGLTLSEFMGMATKKQLSKQKQKKLTERVKPGRKKGSDTKNTRKDRNGVFVKEENL